MKINAVIETAIYVDDLDKTEAFYRTILGLPVIVKEHGRHVFFQVGDNSVLLAFIAEATLKSGERTPHGATGPGHFALGIDTDASTLGDKNCATTASPSKTRSFGRAAASRSISAILAGNLAELVTPGIWGLPSGW